MPCLNIDSMTPKILSKKRPLSTPLLPPTDSDDDDDIQFSTPTRIATPFTHPPSRTSGIKLLDVLTHHLGSVSCLALCGEFVLSASQARDIIVWQQPDMRFFTRFGSGEGSVKSILTSGNNVFTAHQDSRIRVWKVSRRLENVFRLVDSLPTTRDYLGNCLNQKNYVEIRRHHKKLWIEHADSISCLAVDNGFVYSGSWDKTLKVWRVRDFKCLLSVKAHDDAINGLVVDREGLVYSASADGKVKVWERQHTLCRIQDFKIRTTREQPHSGSHCLKVKATLEGHKDVSINAVIVDNNKTVFGGASDGFLMGWRRRKDEEEWRLVVEVKAHQMAVLCMCFMGDVLLCSGSADKSICLWKREKIGGVCKVGVIKGHQGPIKCLQASPNCVGDGYLLYSGSLDKSLRVWWVSKEIKDDETN